MKKGANIFGGLIAIVLIIAGTGIFTFVTVNGQISVQTRIALIALYAFAIAACVVTAMVFVRNTLKEISKGSKVFERAADGDFDFEIKIGGKSGRSLASFEKLKSNVMGIEAETKKIWTGIGSGHWDIRTDTSRLSGEFRKIASEFNEVMDKVEDRMKWYESILDAVQFPVHVTDDKMKWVYMNKAFEKLLMESGAIKNRASSYGMDCCNAGANICNTEKCGIKQLLKGKDESYFDWSGMNCKQETSYLRNKKGETIGYVEVVTDLSSVLRANSFAKAEAQKLERNLHKMAQGSLSLDYTVADADEYTEDERKLFTDINGNLKEAVDAISEYIGQIKTALEKILQGDLRSEITYDFKGDYSQIKDALNRIVDGLNDVMGNISISADQVASGSSQVSDGSQALAQGATEQASAVEQLTASVTDIAAKTRENATAAAQAKTITEKSRADAETGSKQMDKLLKSMNDINESSAGISKVIKVIDEIAFQTNMLALNAAVEAARAGQYGKGFEVVANEVRSLAAKSASAVSETTSMIESSIQKSQAGSKIAAETAESFKNILEGAEKSAKLVEVIANYSNDQATGIAQINKGLEQVSQVVQTNSATSEESAASSEELSAQAAELKRLISRFDIRSSGSGKPMKEAGGQNPSDGKFKLAAAASEKKISLPSFSDKY